MVLANPTYEQSSISKTRYGCGGCEGNESDSRGGSTNSIRNLLH